MSSDLLTSDVDVARHGSAHSHARKLNGASLAAAFMWADAAGIVDRCGQFPVCRLPFKSRLCLE
jgi:hypothetical protein